MCFWFWLAVAWKRSLPGVWVCSRACTHEYSFIWYPKEYKAVLGPNPTFVIYWHCKMDSPSVFPYCRLPANEPSSQDWNLLLSGVFLQVSRALPLSMATRAIQVGQGHAGGPARYSVLIWLCLHTGVHTARHPQTVADSLWWFPFLELYFCPSVNLESRKAHLICMLFSE